MIVRESRNHPLRKEETFRILPSWPEEDEWLTCDAAVRGQDSTEQLSGFLSLHFPQVGFETRILGLNISLGGDARKDGGSRGVRGKSIKGLFTSRLLP